MSFNIEKMSNFLTSRSNVPAGALKRVIEQKSLISQVADLANIAQEIRMKRREQYGEGNMVDDSAERRKDGIARRSRRTKKSIFGDTGGLLNGS